MDIPGFQRIMVDLANLQPDVRYYFKTDDYPDNILQGTFMKFVPPANGVEAQYIFSDYVEKDPEGKIVEKAERITFSSPNNPRDIFVFASRIGGKSRKSKRRNTKSKRRRNRKSKKRR